MCFFKSKKIKEQSNAEIIRDIKNANLLSWTIFVAGAIFSFLTILGGKLSEARITELYGDAEIYELAVASVGLSILAICMCFFISFSILVVRLRLELRLRDLEANK